MRYQFCTKQGVTPSMMKNLFLPYVVSGLTQYGAMSF